MSSEVLTSPRPPTEPEKQAGPQSFRAWATVGLLVVFMVVNWADRSILGLAATPLMDDLGLSETEFGLIGSSFFFLFSVSGVAVGFLGNRISARWLLLILVLLWSLTQLPVVFASSMAVLMSSRIILGAAEGPSNALATHAAYTWFPPERRGLPTSLITSGSSIAKFVMAPLMALIIASFGWRAAFLTLAFIGLVWCALWLMVGGEGPYSVRAEKEAEAKARAKVNAKAKADTSTGTGTGTDADADGSATVPALTEGERKVPLRKILLSGSFVGAVLGTFPLYALVTVIMTWLPKYLETGLGFSSVQAGFFFGLPSFAAMLAMIGGSYLTDRLLARGRSNRLARGLVAGAAALVGGVLVALVPLGGAARWVPLVLLIFGYGVGMLCMPLMYSVVGSLAPTGQRAGVLGVFLALQNSAGIAAPAVAGAIISGSSGAAGYETVFCLAGVITAMGGLAMLLLVDPEREARNLAAARAVGTPAEA